jgi:hypothetical protein
MKTTITMLSIILTSSVLMAAGQQMAKPVEGGICSNMAKYGAIKLFKANQGQEDSNISYDGDIVARAFLTKTEKSDLTYSVSVDEGANEGADDFTVSSNFVVKVRALDEQAKKCKVLSVEEVENP